MTSSGDSLFHQPGLIYFWALNDRLEPAELQAMIDAFAAAGVAAVCLHPRSGLELPYGGTDWFDRITWVVERCRVAGLPVWLYDEDPYPSGAAGGRLLMDHPEFTAYRIERDQAPADLKPGDHFLFAAGKLLWCGFLDDRGQGVIDCTARIGVLRQQWTVLPQWDSRYYYPQTPLYQCARAWTCQTQLALRVPEHDRSLQLVAFTARPIVHDPAQCHWPAKADPLNPLATAAFLASTHERYRQTVGQHFGGHIRAIFTDEPKWHDARPYTADLLADFHRSFGQHLAPSLDHLFNRLDHADAMLTRLRYRQWCADRFREAWVQPVAQWCNRHRLALVGHISPEDDPIQQANCVGNLLPLMCDFALPGIDLIIPATGDAEHPLLNLGVVSATSVRAQRGKPGVLSESLACSGTDFTAAQAQRVLAWQTTMGVTSVVVHAAYQSQEGHRAIDAPPDFGPRSPLWPSMADVSQSLAQAQAVLRRGRQIAPVAILWPIRSFMALQLDWQQDESGLRRDLAHLLLACLERQVGVHLLDEQALHEAAVSDGRIVLGHARYTHVLVPSARLWSQRSTQRLEQFMSQGGTVRGAGQPATWMHHDHGLQPVARWPWPQQESASVVSSLPRLLLAADEDRNLRCTAWQCGPQIKLLLTHLGPAARQMRINGRRIDLQPGEIVVADAPTTAAAPLPAEP